MSKHQKKVSSVSLHRRVLGFDGLRAAAFLMVFISHKAPAPWTDALGSAGVWLFFVLSGFLIARILARSRDEIEAGTSSFSMALKAFYLRRTARITPVYYVFLTVLSVLALRRLVDLGEEDRQLANWFYLANIYIEWHGWRTDLGHLWSLAVEEQFYLAFAPLALLLPRRHLAKLCLCLIGVSVLAHVFLWVRGAWIVSFDVDTAANLGLLALGGLAGLWAECPLPRRLANDAAIVLVLTALVALPLGVADTGLWPVVGRPSGLLMALLLVQIIQCQYSRIVRLLEISWIREIGLISYGAYLFHPVIHADRLLPLVGIHIQLRHSVMMVIELSITLVLAELSWRLLERPVRALLRSNRVAHAGTCGADLQIR